MSLLSFCIPCDAAFMIASTLTIELFSTSIIFEPFKYLNGVFLQGSWWYSHISSFVIGFIALTQGTFLSEVLFSYRILFQVHLHFLSDLIQSLRIFWNDFFLAGFFLFEYHLVFFKENELITWIYFRPLQAFNHDFFFIRLILEL